MRQLRAGRGWSPGERAEHLGISCPTVNAVETGKSAASRPPAPKIARRFGQPVEKIFTFEE